MAAIRLRACSLTAPTVLAAFGVLAASATISACSSAPTHSHSAGNRLQLSYMNTVKKVLPSVVEINAGNSTGSGVVLNAHGDIVTNAHVVGTEKHVQVLISGVSLPVKARVVGTFPPDDLAVIKVSGPHVSDLKPARWAKSSTAQVGQIVLAMGSPYGLRDSVTQGIVSATGRAVSGPKMNGQRAEISDAIQTSAAINPGNSGGALVLLSGEVLGIPTLAATDPELGTPASGISFAIPSQTVLDITDQLVSSGKVTKSDRASLDITGRTHTSSAGNPNGVSVDQAAPGGAAAAAGIRAGAVIVGLGGQAVTSVNFLDGLLIHYRPGERTTVEVLRSGKPHQVKVTLGSMAG